jgi:FkbM family methyltransferase
VVWSTKRPNTVTPGPIKVIFHRKQNQFREGEFQKMSVLLFFIASLMNIVGNLGSNDWILNDPPMFQSSMEMIKAPASHLKYFDDVLSQAHGYIYKTGDGEFIDVAEHFFYGMINGTAIELGAVDGTLATASQTAMLEMFGWRRILIEGCPMRREALKKNHLAFVAATAICKKEGTVHYVTKTFTSGILEFMSYSFMMDFMPAMSPFVSNHSDGSIQVIPGSNLPKYVRSVSCVPLSKVLAEARIHHINLIILDVEGGELDVLETIDWEITRFDVMVVETEPKYRSHGYFSRVKEFLEQRGYVVYIAELGRNSIFHHKDFIASAKPGVAKPIFNGFQACEKKRRVNEARHQAALAKQKGLSNS